VPRILLAAIAISACSNGGVPAHASPAPHAGSGATASLPVATGWARIAELAAPGGERGPSTELVHAMQLAATNRQAWRELEFKYPPTPLADYPQGAEAVDALVKWAAADGALAPPVAPQDRGAEVLKVDAVAIVAIRSATAQTTQGLIAAELLGNELVRSGRAFVEVDIGLSIIKRAQRRMLELGGSTAGWKLPGDDLVRALAAEALSSKQMLDYVGTAAGRKDFEERLASLGSDTAAIATATTGRAPAAWLPSPEEAAALRTFWLDALDGAQLGEPSATTIARATKAAEALPEAYRWNADAVVRILERMAQSVAALHAPPNPDRFKPRASE
jgi:hypothetical protein